MTTGGAADGEHHPKRPKAPALREDLALASGAVGGGALAWLLKSPTSNLARAVAVALLLTFCVGVNAAIYHAQRRKEPTWTVRSYLNSGFPWGPFVLAWVGYILVSDPSAFKDLGP